ncbi:MAG: PaaX family transcriptional regulator C-terminal domain-containing protein [Stappiaceae bacterium]
MTLKTDTRVSPELERLIEKLHCRGRLRVWSIIFTIFGDAVEPRGGILSAGSLSTLLDRLRIEPGAVRAALSRLAAEGWLERTRRGRNSFYAMSPAGRRRMNIAITKVYSGSDPLWDGQWCLCLTPAENRPKREVRKQLLMARGFVALTSSVFIQAKTDDVGVSDDHESDGTDGCVLFYGTTENTGNLCKMVSESVDLDGAQTAYATLIDNFQPLGKLLDSGKILTPLDAMAARTLLIHDFRRAVLKDPSLPANILGEDWKAPAARKLTGALYKKLLTASETWLDGCSGGIDGPLPNSDPGLMQRFVKSH